MLPKSLFDALALFEKEPLFTKEFGKIFVDYYIRIKRTELQRYETFAKDYNIDAASDATTDWEQNEYFDLF